MAIQDPTRKHESMILYAQLLEARNRVRRWFFINWPSRSSGAAIAGHLRLRILEP
jgi:hypothetical protein